MTKAREAWLREEDVDHEHLRSRLRLLKHGDLLVIAERAMARLGAADLLAVTAAYVRVQKKPAGRREEPLLEEVLAFSKRALAGAYYEGFFVTSANFNVLSGKTQAFIADFDRLMDRILGSAPTEDPVEVREMFELLFAPLRRVDEGMDDVLFFGDEGGSWQVGVHWEAVLPVYFSALAKTAEPAEYATEVDRVIADFVEESRGKMMAAARGAAVDDAQRSALDGVRGKRRRRR